MDADEKTQIADMSLNTSSFVTPVPEESTLNTSATPVINMSNISMKWSRLHQWIDDINRTAETMKNAAIRQKDFFGDNDITTSDYLEQLKLQMKKLSDPELHKLLQLAKPDDQIYLNRVKELCHTMSYLLEVGIEAVNAHVDSCADLKQDLQGKEIEVQKQVTMQEVRVKLLSEFFQSEEDDGTTVMTQEDAIQDLGRDLNENLKAIDIAQMEIERLRQILKDKQSQFRVVYFELSGFGVGTPGLLTRSVLKDGPRTFAEAARTARAARQLFLEEVSTLKDAATTARVARQLFLEEVSTLQDAATGDSQLARQLSPGESESVTPNMYYFDKWARLTYEEDGLNDFKHWLQFVCYGSMTSTIFDKATSETQFLEYWKERADEVGRGMIEIDFEVMFNAWLDSIYDFDEFEVPDLPLERKRFLTRHVWKDQFESWQFEKQSRDCRNFAVDTQGSMSALYADFAKLTLNQSHDSSAHSSLEDFLTALSSAAQVEAHIE